MIFQRERELQACFLAAVVLLAGGVNSSAAAWERFDGHIARPQLEGYLSRSITMEGLLTDHGDLDDQLRLLQQTGARFAGRVIYLWGGEKNLAPALAGAAPRERKLHTAMPDLMLQAAIFEIITEDVGTLPIPARVTREFGVTNGPRNFSYETMLFPDGKHRNQWRKGSSVPDITQIETQMWFYNLATLYLDLGVEAIHFGQVDLMAPGQAGYRAWDSLLGRVRAYARLHGRRGLVICDGHVPRGGVVVEGRLLLDFHSFPLRIDEVPDHPIEGVLRMGYLDSLFGRSKGGITPSGWTCEYLPYLVEFDNFGRSRREGQNIGGCWIWGYDEICWFAHLTRPQRDRWLRYSWQWVREHDPNGYVEMPGSRTLAAPAEKKNWYWASDSSPGCPGGFGDETTIRDIWKSDTEQKTANK
jgi:hypothetical protein